MSEIEALTPAQLSCIPEFFAGWRAIGLSTAPTDRSAAESAIRRCYRRARIKVPKKFIWLRSPFAGALAYTLLKYSKAAVRAGVAVSIGDNVCGRIRGRVSPYDITVQYPADILHNDVITIFIDIRECVRDSVRASLEGAGLQASIENNESESLSAIVQDSIRAVCGSHEAGWLSFYSYFLEVGGIKKWSGERLEGLFEQASDLGWWWPLQNLVIATEKPVSLHLDDRGRLHHAAEPAIAYGDGWGVYAWHGTRIPPQYYSQAITAQQILEESNAEARRALIERYGQDRFFVDAVAAVLDRDPDHGAELIAIHLQDDPERRMLALKLRCPSTSKVYIVRVPPNKRTARTALAWSYGLKRASDYKLAGES
jgi:hypothetical protein